MGRQLFLLFTRDAGAAALIHLIFLSFFSFYYYFATLLLFGLRARPLNINNKKRKIRR
jgi:hypothetical protein